MTLPKYNWDQANILNLATARGFEAVGIKAATIRKWASLDKIRAVGKAPGGAHLYRVADVLKNSKETHPRRSLPN